MVELIHGREAVTSAISAAQALFSRDITTLDEQGFLDSLKSAPTTRLHRTALASGKTLIDLLAETGLCSSKGAARKDIQGGGIYVNSRRIEDINETISADQLLHSKYLALRKGKKNYHLVVFDTE
jgi:tyrosyl-tRNA synthetase